MPRPSLFLVALLALCLLGCASEQEMRHSSTAPSASAAPEPGFRTTQTIYITGEHRGYLTTYDQPPINFDTENRLPAGTAFIQDVNFDNLGFITPTGHLWRLEDGKRTQLVGQSTLIKNLALFFEASQAEVSLGEF